MDIICLIVSLCTFGVSALTLVVLLDIPTAIKGRKKKIYRTKPPDAVRGGISEQELQAAATSVENYRKEGKA